MSHMPTAEDGNTGGTLGAAGAAWALVALWTDWASGSAVTPVAVRQGTEGTSRHQGRAVTLLQCTTKDWERPSQAPVTPVTP